MVLVDEAVAVDLGVRSLGASGAASSTSIVPCASPVTSSSVRARSR
jgi:hypothetical protein